jgi:hypothetical protein
MLCFRNRAIEPAAAAAAMEAREWGGLGPAAGCVRAMRCDRWGLGF